MLLRLNLIRHQNAIALYTKYLHFLKFLHAPPYPQPWSETLSMHGYWIRQRETVAARRLAYYHLHSTRKQKPRTFLYEAVIAKD